MNCERSEASTVGELARKEREIEPGSKQAADRDEAERGEQPSAIAARVMIRVARRAHTPRFQGAFIRVPLLLYIAHAPRGLVREHDEGEREEQADKPHYSRGAVACKKARHGRPQRTAPPGVGSGLAQQLAVRTRRQRLLDFWGSHKSGPEYN